MGPYGRGIHRPLSDVRSKIWWVWFGILISQPASPAGLHEKRETYSLDLMCLCLCHYTVTFRSLLETNIDDSPDPEGNCVPTTFPLPAEINKLKQSEQYCFVKIRFQLKALTGQNNITSLSLSIKTLRNGMVNSSKQRPGIDELWVLATILAQRRNMRTILLNASHYDKGHAANCPSWLSLQPKGSMFWAWDFHLRTLRACEADGSNSWGQQPRSKPVA